MEFIGGDEGLFKLIMSMQVEISEEFFQKILAISNELGIQPNRVLELGRANGWAS
jgi:hypothetical protein